MNLPDTHCPCLCLGGIPGDHLIVPVSDHAVSSPMHLRLGQKEKLWTGEYIEKEDQDGTGGIAPIGDEEEINNLYSDDLGGFESKGWENNGEDGDGEVEEEEDQEKVEWEEPEFFSQSTNHHHSHQDRHHEPQQTAETLGEASVKTLVSRAEGRNLFQSYFSRYRAMRRLRRLRRLRSRVLPGFQLAQHWKSWRQKARWMFPEGHHWNRRGHKYKLYGKPRRTKRLSTSVYSDEEGDGREEQFKGASRGRAVQTCQTSFNLFKRKHAAQHCFISSDNN